jgi:hypothetical protein
VGNRRSGVAYRDVGEGHEQDAEASRRDSRRGRRSYNRSFSFAAQDTPPLGSHIPLINQEFTRKPDNIGTTGFILY